MLNLEKIWHELLTDLSTSPVRCSHFTLGHQKSHFSTLLFIYFKLFTLAEKKKTNSNCCTAALAVYLLLFRANYYLHSPSTASGARYRRSTCTDMDMLRLAAAACCDKGWIITNQSHSTPHCAEAQSGVLCDWLVLKKTEACINAEGGHSEHLLWHCLPDIPVAIHHNRLFSEPPMTNNWLFSEAPTLERMQQTYKWVWWHFQVWWAGGLQFVFVWDNTNNTIYDTIRDAILTCARKPT